MLDYQRVAVTVRTAYPQLSVGDHSARTAVHEEISPLIFAQGGRVLDAFRWTGWQAAVRTVFDRLFSAQMNKAVLFFDFITVALRFGICAQQQSGLKEICLFGRNQFLSYSDHVDNRVLAKIVIGDSRMVVQLLTWGCEIVVNLAVSSHGNS